MVTRHSKMTALHKLAGDVADHVESVVSAGEVEVESVATMLIVAAIAVVSAEASGGNGVVQGAARGVVSESSSIAWVRRFNILQGTVGVVMANGGVMRGAAVTVVVAEAGLAEASDNRFGPCGY
jgi:hypothetical protein